MVLVARLELAWHVPMDFKSIVSTNFTTRALNSDIDEIITDYLPICQLTLLQEQSRNDRLRYDRVQHIHVDYIPRV